MMDFLQDTYFWTSVSFVVFVAILWVYGRKTALDLVDSYIANIRARIQEAETLHYKAKAQADEFAARTQGAEAEANAIIEQAKQDALALVAQGKAEMEKRLAARQKQFDQEIKQLEDDAINELRLRMAAMLEEMTRANLDQLLDKDASTALIDQSIQSARDLSKRAA